MDWTKWITDLFAAGVGGLIGATLGAYYKSYWTEKGKNLATYQDIQTLLAEERVEAYEQEKGKRLATHEDIENVLREVQAVTRETETIKAQIGTEVWNRQTVWNERRNLYAELIEAIHEQRQLISQFELLKLQYPEVDPGDIAIPSHLLTELLASVSKYKRHAALAQIFLDADAYNALTQYVYPNPPVAKASEEIYGPTGSRRLNALEMALIKAAQKDLKVS